MSLLEDKALNIHREIRKHLHIYWLFVKISTMGYMEYRANLFAALTMELTYLFSKIIYVIFVYQSGISLKGVSPDEIMIFIGTFIIMTGIFTAFFMENFYGIPGHIRDGTLDMYITKPVSLQFLSTLQHVNLVLPVPNLITGIALVTVAWKRLGIPVTFMNIAGYLLILLSSTCITYAIFLFPQIFSFWTVKSSAVTEIVDKCWDFNNMPMFIYKKWMQRIGVFVIPIFFITNIPSMFLIGKLNSLYIIWAIAAPVLFLTGIRQFWKFAVRNYTSASS